MKKYHYLRCLVVPSALDLHSASPMRRRSCDLLKVLLSTIYFRKQMNVYDEASGERFGVVEVPLQVQVPE